MSAVWAVIGSLLLLALLVCCLVLFLLFWRRRTEYYTDEKGEFSFDIDPDLTLGGPEYDHEYWNPLDSDASMFNDPDEGGDVDGDEGEEELEVELEFESSEFEHEYWNPLDSDANRLNDPDEGGDGDVDGDEGEDEFGSEPELELELEPPEYEHEYLNPLASGEGGGQWGDEDNGSADWFDDFGEGLSDLFAFDGDDLSDVLGDGEYDSQQQSDLDNSDFDEGEGAVLEDEMDLESSELFASEGNPLMSDDFGDPFEVDASPPQSGSDIGGNWTLGVDEEDASEWSVSALLGDEAQESGLDESDFQESGNPEEDGGDEAADGYDDLYDDLAFDDDDFGTWTDE